MVKSFFQNLQHRAVAFGHRANHTFNAVKIHARNALPIVRKAAMLVRGVNKFTNHPYVSEAAAAVHAGTYAAEKALDGAENIQRKFGLPTHRDPMSIH